MVEVIGFLLLLQITAAKPEVELAMDGPHLKYLGRKAHYTLTVTNTGTVPAANVRVQDVVPGGFKFLSAGDGGRNDFSTRTVTWLVGDLAPGKAMAVKLECEAINPGDWHHKVVCEAGGVHAERDFVTRVEGLSALLVEVVDTEDPVEIGTDTAFEIRITNTGSRPESNIRIVATLQKTVRFSDARGPTGFTRVGKGRELQTIVFQPIKTLAPRADAIYRISGRVLSEHAAGGDLKVTVTADSIVDPIVATDADGRPRYDP